MSSTPCSLAPHGLNIALVRPQIAPNTGNIARLCVATGSRLHLVRPLGFVLSDRNLRRSAMDYWPRLQLTIHDDDSAFLQAAQTGPGRAWFFSSKADKPHWSASFGREDWLIFGNETQGLPGSWLERNAEYCLRIPQMPEERCLNLSTAAGIGVYEALRQLNAPLCSLSPVPGGEGGGEGPEVEQPGSKPL